MAPLGLLEQVLVRRWWMQLDLHVWFLGCSTAERSRSNNHRQGRIAKKRGKGVSEAHALFASLNATVASPGGPNIVRQICSKKAGTPLCRTVWPSQADWHTPLLRLWQPLNGHSLTPFTTHTLQPSLPTLRMAGRWKASD